MGKEKFLKELEYLLMDLSEEERQEALQYYRDYFEDAGLEHEQDILRELGSPERTAAELKGSLNGQEDGGEFSERGYRAEWYTEERVPDHYTELAAGKRSVGDRSSKRRKAWQERWKEKWRSWHSDNADEANRAPDDEIAKRRRNGLLFLILFLIFGLPIAGTILSAGASIVLAVLAALLGGIAGLVALCIGAVVLVAAIFAAGVALIIAGCLGISVLPVGLMCIGGGFLILAAAFLLMIAVKWGFRTVIPGFLGFLADLIKAICSWIRKAVSTLRSRGGAAQ